MLLTASVHVQQQQGQDSSVLGTSASSSGYGKSMGGDFGLDSQRQSFARGFPSAAPQPSQVCSEHACS